jgi:hypothetical protein
MIGSDQPLIPEDKQMSIPLNFDDDELRKTMERIIAQQGDSQFLILCSAIAQTDRKSPSGAAEYGLHQFSYGTPQLSPHDCGRVHDIIWDLIIEGYIRPGLGDGQNNDLPHYHITKKGKVHFEAGNG